MASRVLHHPALLRARWRTALDIGGGSSGASSLDELVPASAPAALLASGCGGPVLRLDGRWNELLQGLIGIGNIQVSVHHGEARQTAYGLLSTAQLTAGGGWLYGPGLDLRVFFDRWAHGFAGLHDTDEGVQATLAFFDRSGQPVLGIRLGPHANTDAFSRLIYRHRHADQRSCLLATQASPLSAGCDQRAMAASDAVLHPLLRGEQPRRLEALRSAGPLARAVDPQATVNLLRVIAERRDPLCWLGGNHGAALAFRGRACRCLVEDDSVCLAGYGFIGQLQAQQIASAWVVQRQLDEHHRPLLELYDAGERLIAALGGPQSECPVWNALLLGLPAPGGH